MKNHHIGMIAVFSLVFLSCNKMLEVKAPINSITTDQVFQNDQQADLALNGLYSYLINGGEANSSDGALLGVKVFSTGGVSILAGYSADEFYQPGLSSSSEYYSFQTNKLTINNAKHIAPIWNSAYKAIYNANSIIEGVDASTSKEFHPETRLRIKAEAKTVRAMSYFYLVNLFEKVPLVLTIDFNSTRGLPSAMPPQIYTQMIKDLEEAIPDLSDEFTGVYTERIRVTSWFAKALLSRVYLFRKEYEKAWFYSNQVLENTGLFNLENLNTTFKRTSKEVIFQLKHDSATIQRKNAVPESLIMSRFYLTPDLMALFEQNDNRKTAWIAPILPTNGTPAGFAPSKYKINNKNFVTRGPRTEYYVVMRLAELYLIRAEANFLRNATNKNFAIDDLNAIRLRAGADLLPHNLSENDFINAVAKERRIELFAEWGHHWLDLKRTGKSSEAFADIQYKKPWDDRQLLYPVPKQEIEWNNNLSQNDGY